MSNSLFNGISIALILSGCYTFFMETYQVALDALKNMGGVITGAAHVEQVPDAMFMSFIAFGLIGCAITSALDFGAQTRL